MSRSLWITLVVGLTTWLAFPSGDTSFVEAQEPEGKEFRQATFDEVVDYLQGEVGLPKEEAESIAREALTPREGVGRHEGPVEARGHAGGFPQGLPAKGVSGGQPASFSGELPAGADAWTHGPEGFMEAPGHERWMDHPGGSSHEVSHEVQRETEPPEPKEVSMEPREAPTPDSRETPAGGHY